MKDEKIRKKTFSMHTWSGFTLWWISWMPTSLVRTSRHCVPKSFMRAKASSLKLPCSTPLDTKGIGISLVKKWQNARFIRIEKMSIWYENATATFFSYDISSSSNKYLTYWHNWVLSSFVARWLEHKPRMIFLREQTIVFKCSLVIFVIILG